MIFEKGSVVIYAEFEENDVTKRFIFPQLGGITEKIPAFIESHEGISVVRLGRATVTSSKEPDEAGVGLSAIDSPVTLMYELEIMDHPVLSEGLGRYSPNLIKLITTIEVQHQTELVSDDLPAPTIMDQIRQAKEDEGESETVDLTSQLKTQMAQQKIAETSTKKKSNIVEVPAPGHEPPSSVKPVADISEPSDNAQHADMSLTEFLRKNKKQKQPMVLFENKRKPVSKIDRILEKLETLEILLGVSDGEELEGEQLKEWFESHVKEIGEKETFDLLATKLAK